MWLKREQETNKIQGKKKKKTDEKQEQPTE